MIDYAAWYATMGIPVFPVKTGDKTPITAHGCKDATDDPDQVEQWWTRWPDANIGIATGVGAVPLLVLDVDVGHGSGHDGLQTIKELEAEYGKLPRTLVCQTGGGGLHYYFRCSDPCLTVGANALPGLDFRGRGGYVVAPPSIHKSGKRYEWLPDGDPRKGTLLAELPDWLADILRKGKPVTGEPRAADGPATIPEGRRNEEMFKLASSLRAKGLSETEMLAALVQINEERCDPPLSEGELKTLCHSAGRYERGTATRDSPGNTEEPALICAADVEYSPPKWLISPYFQRGKGTLIQADPGTGKTAFMCAIAASVTTGVSVMGLPVETPGNVLMLSVEDDLGVLRGRIGANNGDPNKVFFMSDAACLTINSPQIEQAVKQVAARLLIFDPLQAFLGAKIDMHRANETRPALAKLFEMCARNDCACAIIAHTGKNGLGKSPVNQSIGSVDIPAAMRSVIHITRNPEDDTECIAVHVKSSNAARGASIAYGIVDRGGVEWHGFCDFGIEDLNAVQKRAEKGVPYENEPLVKVFNKLIADRPGGGFWAYDDVKSIGAKLVGFPPFSTPAELRTKLAGSLARELQTKDGLIVTCGHKQNGLRGIRIEQYSQPSESQTGIPP